MLRVLKFKEFTGTYTLQFFKKIQAFSLNEIKQKRCKLGLFVSRLNVSKRRLHKHKQLTKIGYAIC